MPTRYSPRGSETTEVAPMAKIPIEVFLAKELLVLDQALLNLDARSLRRAAKALWKLGQHQASVGALGAAVSSERAFAGVKAARDQRRRSLRKMGFKFCKCGTPLAKWNCGNCGGRGCVLCHQTGKNGIRTVVRGSWVAHRSASP